MRRLGGEVIFIVAAAACFLAGIGLLVLGVFWALETALGRPAAAAICGAISLLIAGGIVWTIKRLYR